jgi:hypothetical protein
LVLARAVLEADLGLPARFSARQGLLAHERKLFDLPAYRPFIQGSKMLLRFLWNTIRAQPRPMVGTSYVAA